MTSVMITNSIRFILIFLIGVIPALSVYAQSSDANSPNNPHKPGTDINKPFKNNPDVKTWEAKLERPGREVFDKRRKIVSALNLKKGMVVADIGAGTGLFSRMFSPRVGADGKVYVVDISKNFVEAILRRAKRARMTNITGVINSATDVKLPKNSIDLAFICDTYHHFEYPDQMLKTIRQSLRKNGTLVIIDYRKKSPPGSKWVLAHVRSNKAAVIKEITGQGFKFEQEKPILKYNYFLRFRKLSDH